jgi:dienelactone hydrolase
MRLVAVVLGVLIGLAHIPLVLADAQTISYKSVIGGREEEREALLCMPKGDGPFPVAIFNHGSIVDGWGWPGARARGYRLDRVCEALASEGIVTFAPIREINPRGRGFRSYEEKYREIVMRAVDHAKTLAKVDPSRVALVGFSMGGLVSFLVSTDRSDLRALALLAPAAGRGVITEQVQRASAISAPTLVLIEAGDAPPILKGVDMIERTMRDQNKNIKVIRYDRGGGHELFYDLGYWWDDLRIFLREHLSSSGTR